MSGGAATIPIYAEAIRGNIVLTRLLALCPMLAVSVSAATAATLGMLTLGVMAAAGLTVSTLRGLIPLGVRLPIFLLVVAALVAAADVGMEALAPQMHRELGIFLPLIMTNCAVLARLEVFASKQPPGSALADGAITGLGMLAVIVLLAVVREWLGTGGIAPILAARGGWLPSALSPAGGFMIFGLLIAAARKLKITTA